MTDVNGLATFETIFPGRYTGCTPHIHAHNLSGKEKERKFYAFLRS